MRGVVLLAAALAGAIGIAGAAACEDSRREEGPLVPDGGGGAAPPVDGGAGGGGEGGGAPQDDGGDGGLSPVVVGITPTPRSDQGEPTAGDVLEAEVTTFAAGVRGVVVTRAPRELDAEAYDALAMRAGLYADHGKQVLFDLAIVDRAVDGRPDDVAGLAWDDPAVLDAVHDAVDGVIATFGGTLGTLAFGRDVDVYLGEHPGERGAFAVLAEEACAYAKAHPDAPEGLRVGVGLSFEAAAAPDATTAALLGAGDVTVLSYMPGLAGGQAAPASDVAGALDAMAALAGGRPVVLQGIGYPSDEAAGGSEEKQRLFYETFFDALAPRRDAFAFVNVVELHDPSPEGCAAWAAAQGTDPDGSVARFACSLGLFGQGEAEKAAWLEVVGGVATFATP